MHFDFDPRFIVGRCEPFVVTFVTLAKQILRIFASGSATTWRSVFGLDGCLRANILPVHRIGVSFVYLYGHSWSVLWLYDSLLGFFLSDYIYDDDRFGWGGINLYIRRSFFGLNCFRSRITLRSTIVSHEWSRLFLRDRLHF